MSKFSKILTVLLSVCLLFGATTAFLATAVETAASDVANPFEVTKVAESDDFTGTGSYTVTSSSSKSIEQENSKRSAYLKYTYITKSGNTYGRLHYSNADLSSITSLTTAETYQGSYAFIANDAAANGTSDYKAGRPKDSDGNYTDAYSYYDLRNFDVFTYEFDLGSDAYAYTITIDGKTYYATAESEDAALAKLKAEQKVANVSGATVVNNGLAFPSHLSFVIDIDTSISSDANGYDSGASSSVKWNHKKSATFFVFKKNDSWYIGPTNNNTAGALPLSGEIGVFDHISVVYNVNKDADGNIVSITPYLYVNGVYATTFSNWTPDTKDGQYNMLKRMFSQIYTAATGTFNQKMYDKYSVAFDNVAINYYTEEEANVEGGFGALMNELSEGITTTPLYNVEGALFRNYPSPNGYICVDGSYTSVPELFPDAFSRVQNNSVVEAGMDITDFDIPDGVESFILYYDPDTTDVTLAKSDAARYVFFDNGDGSYTVRTPRDDEKIQLKRIVDYNGTKIAVSSEIFVFVLQPKSTTSFTVAFDLSTLTLYENKGFNGEWKIDVDGKVPESINLYDDEALRSLTGLEADLIKEEFDGILYAYATAEEGSIEATSFADYAYIAGYENNGVFTPILDSNNGYDNYKNIDTLEAEMENWDDDVVYYLIEDGVAVSPIAPSMETGAAWNLSSLNTPDTMGGTAPAGITDLVKNTVKGNGTVDNYGLLIIR